ncbi:hypothetical protein [Burkholderia pseudomallei]|uniref:hypothetical protein n=1 Tax=Burkholderia pseudomallei TaxID=28450 RepID=UPI0018C5F771|nr:hypothetical protein [Burkholderia pseudomallei]MBG1252209.1 hypothetical protein [Burkholderia pseudomallei]
MQTPIFANVNVSNQLYFGFWVKGPLPNTDASSSYGNSGLGLPNSNGGSFSLVTAGVTVSGAVQLLKLGSTTTLATGTVNICDNNWHWVEIGVLLSSTSSGWAKVYVDGVQQINYSGATMSGAYTLNGNITLSFLQNTNGSNQTWYYDDFIAWDNTGTSMNTFPLGPQRISTLVPNADGDTLQFTPSTAGTHYTCVDGDYTATSYVSDGATGNTDLYKFPSLAYNPANISAVVAQYWGQNPGTGSANLIAKLKTNGTLVSGNTFGLSNGANHLYTNPFYTDASGAAWTATSVNAMQVGLGD